MTNETNPRLQEFQAQVDDLKLAGGKANPEITSISKARKTVLRKPPIQFCCFVGILIVIAYYNLRMLLVYNL